MMTKVEPTAEILAAKMRKAHQDYLENRAALETKGWRVDYKGSRDGFEIHRQPPREFL